MENFIIVPRLKMRYELLLDYWDAVYKADLLKYRLSDIKDPNLDDVQSMMQYCMNNMFFIVCTDTAEIKAEFTLLNRYGSSMHVHFSMHPDNEFKSSLNYAATATDIILNRWVQSGKPDEPYLHTLVGLTPALNRRACLFISKVGFKKQCVIPNSGLFLGEVCDMSISIKCREA